MKKIFFFVLTISSLTFNGQQILNQSQETRTDNLYFGVSQSGYNFGTTIPISARFAAWGTSSPFNYNAAGVFFTRWLGSGTLFTNAYVGQAYNSQGVGLSFDVSNVNAINEKPLRRMFINNNGYVGIGSEHPDEKLTVKGKIHAEEVRVDLNVPADYVFQKYYTGASLLKHNYKMLTLSEVENFIKRNHHLPELPSAEQIQKEGLHLKEMTNLLLQKIEELTLYAIEQQKTIEKLKIDINDLKAKK